LKIIFKGININTHVHEVFRYPYQRGMKEPRFLEHYLSSMKTTRTKNLLLKYLWYWYLPQLKNEAIDYIFFSRKYEHIYHSMPNKKSLVFVPLKKLNLIKKKDNIIYANTKYFDYCLEKIFKNDPLLHSKSSQKYINFIVQIFERINPKLFIVHNDSLFMERFLIYCAKKAGIKTICIQHGLFQSKSDPYVFDGKYADLMLAWSNQQKDVLINGGLPKEQIKVFGYPHKIYKPTNKTTLSDKKKICILGQPWETYDTTLGEIKKVLFQKIVNQLKTDAIAYKPHPAERDLNFVPNDVKIFDRSLNEAFEEFDYFFSLTSSALLEATLANKIAIQIFDERFHCDDFETIGISYSLPSKEIDHIIDYLEKIIKPFEINKHAISIPQDIEAEFDQLTDM